MSLPLHGWRSLPLGSAWETLALALYRRGERIATVTVFEDGDGPYYAEAITPDGSCLRLGAGSTLAHAIAWSEERSGFRNAARVDGRGGSDHG